MSTFTRNISLSLGRSLVGILLTLGCLGCWEEIHYQPEHSSTKAPAPSEAAPPIASEQKAESAQPTPSSEELFETPAGEPEDTLLEGMAKSEIESLPINEGGETAPQVEDALPGGPANPANAPGPADREEFQPVDEEISLWEKLYSNESAPEAGDDPVGSIQTVEPFIELPDSEEAAPPEAVPTERDSPSRSRLAAWKLSSTWSLAAGLMARGHTGSRFESLLQDAGAAAEQLQIELPELSPRALHNRSPSEIVAFLLEEAGPDLAEQLKSRYGNQHAALAELAIKTNLLLLIYTPRSSRLDPLVETIHTAAENSGLSRDVWREILSLLDRRATYDQVKAAVFALHRAAEMELDPTTDQ